MLRVAKRTLQILAAAGALGALAASPSFAADPGAFTTRGAWSFTSAPNLHPPKLSVDKPAVSKKLAPGYFFLSNFKNLLKTDPMTGEGGPMIVDSHLQPVWFLPIGTKTFANNLRVQTYEGKPALSWWQGIITNTGATTSGEIHLVDQHYRPIGKPLSGADGWIITQHEALVSGHDIWVTAVKVEPMNLSGYGGSAQGTLLNAAVQKYDLRTGRLLYTWDAGPDPASKQPGHIPLSDSYQPLQPPGAPWDAYHINSIQLGPNGFITTMRNTWAAYSVNTSGGINWILGGKEPTFKPAGTSAQFQWPHDIEVHAGGLVTVFDDNCCAVIGPGQLAKPNGLARAVELKLNANKTVSFVRQFTRNLYVGFQGNAQLQANGNMVVGWGSQPYFTEFGKTGQVLFDGVLPGADLSYRAYVSKWVGRPYFPPSGAARNKRGKATVYASWDGATQVVVWRVLAGPDAKQLKTVAARTRTGFETVIPLTRRYNTFKVQALDVKGHVLGTSKLFSVPKAGSKPSPPGFY
jgi:hypothetical protein